MIESFISPNKEEIKELKTGLIYGDLLDNRLFIQNNFDELLNKMNKIKQQIKPNNEDLKTQQNFKVKENEKHDKNKIKSGNDKKIKDLLKKYEELGIMKAGDVEYDKVTRENITFYKPSELVNKSESFEEK